MEKKLKITSEIYFRRASKTKKKQARKLGNTIAIKTNKTINHWPTEWLIYSLTGVNGTNVIAVAAYNCNVFINRKSTWAKVLNRIKQWIDQVIIKQSRPREGKPNGGLLTCWCVPRLRFPRSAILSPHFKSLYFHNRSISFYCLWRQWRLEHGESPWGRSYVRWLSIHLFVYLFVCYMICVSCPELHWWHCGSGTGLGENCLTEEIAVQQEQKRNNQTNNCDDSTQQLSHGGEYPQPPCKNSIQSTTSFSQFKI